jgi:quercetin dioxygenase-like cupin family protein
MMTAGVTGAGTGLADVTWNILGQTYRPVALSPASFAFHTRFPPGTFVPPHIHPAQDEFIFVLDGRFELWLDGATSTAQAGDTIRLPMGQAHGIFNKTEADTLALFWVAPALTLYDLFSRLHNLADPAEVVRIAGAYDVHFLPPPAG